MYNCEPSDNMNHLALMNNYVCPVNSTQLFEVIHDVSQQCRSCFLHQLFIA